MFKNDGFSDFTVFLRLICRIAQTHRVFRDSWIIERIPRNSLTPPGLLMTFPGRSSLFFKIASAILKIMRNSRLFAVQGGHFFQNWL